MNDIEFIDKEIRRAEVRLENTLKRFHAPVTEINNIRSRISHLESIRSMLVKMEDDIK